MRCHYRGRSPGVARTLGSGKYFVPLGRVWARGCGLEVHAQFADGGLENRRPTGFRERGERSFHDWRLRPWVAGGSRLVVVVKAMNPRKVAFSEQFCLGCQPMLYRLPGLGTLVQIAEVSSPGHFVGVRHKINFILVQVQVRGRSRPGSIGRFWAAVLGKLVALHHESIGDPRVRSLWGLHPSTRRTPSTHLSHCAILLVGGGDASGTALDGSWMGVGRCERLASDLRSLRRLLCVVGPGGANRRGRDFSFARAGLDDGLRFFLNIARARVSQRCA